MTKSYAFQSQMPKVWGISCYKKKRSVQKAHFKHSLAEKVTPSCCACSKWQKTNALSDVLAAWAEADNGQQERDDPPLKDGWERVGDT